VTLILKEAVADSCKTLMVVLFLVVLTYPEDDWKLNLSGSFMGDLYVEVMFLTVTIYAENIL
jgi:hypothetical protein